MQHSQLITALPLRYNGRQQFGAGPTQKAVESYAQQLLTSQDYRKWVQGYNEALNKKRAALTTMTLFRQEEDKALQALREAKTAAEKVQAGQAYQPIQSRMRSAGASYAAALSDRDYAESQIIELQKVFAKRLGLGKRPSERDFDRLNVSKLGIFFTASIEPIFFPENPPLSTIMVDTRRHPPFHQGNKGG